MFPENKPGFEHLSLFDHFKKKKKNLMQEFIGSYFQHAIPFNLNWTLLF